MLENLIIFNNENAIDSNNLVYMGGILEDVRKYDEEKRNIKAWRKSEFDRINRTMKNDTPEYKQIMFVLENRYNERLQKARENLNDNFTQTLDEIRKKVNSFVDVIIPDDMLKNIDYVEKYGNSLPIEEKHRIAKNCYANYKASVILRNYLFENQKRIAYDEIMQLISDFEETIKTDFIKGTSQYKMLCVLHGDPHAVLDKHLVDFMATTCPADPKDDSVASLIPKDTNLKRVKPEDIVLK